MLAGSHGGAQELNLTDRVQVTGDLRFRYEYIDEETSDTRDRMRVRVRLGVKGKVNDDVDIIVRLASGADDPVSSNTTFGDGFARKAYSLDRGYIDWHPGVAEGLSLWFGKTKNPFYKVEDLVWDDDLNPEGIMLLYGYDTETLDLFANLGFWYAEERKDDVDTTMVGGQIGGDMNFSERAGVVAAMGYYGWNNVQGQEPLFFPLSGFGNTTVDIGTEEEPDLRYVNDYGVFDAMLKGTIDTGVLPVSLFAEYIVNTEAETDGDTGWMVGVTAGKAKDPRSYALKYNYRDLEADASIGAFVDSDIFGGGTDGKGHELAATYQLGKHWQLQGTAFFSKLDPSGDNLDYQRFQLDLKARF
jgi:hypothetical protein